MKIAHTDVFNRFQKSLSRGNDGGYCNNFTIPALAFAPQMHPYNWNCPTTQLNQPNRAHGFMAGTLSFKNACIYCIMEVVVVVGVFLVVAWVMLVELRRW